MQLPLNVDLSNPLGLLALAALIVAAALGGGHLLRVLDQTNRDLDIGLRPLRFGTRSKALQDRSTEKMYSAALARLNDLEQAVVSLVEAKPAELEERTQHWLDFLSEGLATVLSAGNAAHFRIAIWTDDQTDPDYLRGLAYFGFDRHAADYEKLDRATNRCWFLCGE
jgi:hypothetical protein